MRTDAPSPALRLRPAGLRLGQAEGELRTALRDRPADAEAWVWLGWVRRAQGSAPEGAALARHGASLDPRREALRVAAARIAKNGERER